MTGLTQPSPWRLLVWGLAGVLVVAVAQIWLVGVTESWVHWPPLFADYNLYVDATTRWLTTGQFYEAHQLVGPYDVVYGDILYPPTILALLVPFTLLPALFWWLVPLAVTGFCIARHRPSPLGWVVLGALLAWPMGLALMIRVGNPAMWAMAFVALATHKPAWAPFVLLKPTLAPFAALGIWTRTWWLGLVAFAILSVLFLPMWFDYIAVILNARDASGLLYSWQQSTMMAAPVVAFASRRVPATPGQSVR